MPTLTFPQFVALENRPQLNETLEILDNIGCVLNYVPFVLDETPDASSHRRKALEAMDRVVQFYEHRAQTMSNRHYPIENFWRIHFDAAKLEGEPIGAAHFWGNDAAEANWENSVSVGCVVDGYKTAFFQPPMGMGRSVSEQTELFERLNREL